MLVRHLFCNLHTVKLAHYDKLQIRIYLLSSLQYKKTNVPFVVDVSSRKPEPHILVSGAKLSEIHPRPLISHILEGLSCLELVPSQFGPVPRGCILSYQCPPLTPDKPVIDFPQLPLPGFSFSSNLAFVPNLHQALHLESLNVSPTTVYEIEMGTREQSKCAAWAQVRRSRVTASRFREVCHVQGETSGKALATRIIRGTKQTHAMRRGLELEASIIKKYTESTNIIVLPCGFVLHSEAPHVGASPDKKVFDETGTYPFGLVEVKSTSAENVASVPYIKITNGQAKLASLQLLVYIGEAL